MPPKKDGKKKRSAKRTDLWAVQLQLQKLKLAYDEKCKEAKVPPHPYVSNTMKSYIGECKCLAKLVFVGDKTKDASENRKFKFTPLISACRTVRYIHIKEIYIWDYDIMIEEITAFEDFLRQPAYNIQYLEIIDCDLQPLPLKRLVRGFRFSTLTSLVLDYNKFGDEGCTYICDSLLGNAALLGLSLNYCEITSASSEKIGKLISTTAIKNLYLDGNYLGCEGLINLITLVADKAEMDGLERNNPSESSLQDSKLNLLSPVRPTMVNNVSTSRATSANVTPDPSKKKKKKKGKGSKKDVSAPPKVGPWLEKLHIVNNGIDGCGAGKSYAPVICMRLIRKWIANSADVKEVDLDDNSIGDLAAREIALGLEQRKQNELNSVKMYVTHCINSDMFAKILILGSGKSGKKGKRKKGKGKAGKKKI